MKQNKLDFLLISVKSWMVKFKKLKSVNEVSLERNLLDAFMCILAFSLLIYIVSVYPLDGDKATSLATMLGFSAALFAPIGAYLLIDNWKIQKKYDLKKEYLVQILIDLKPIFIELVETREVDARVKSTKDNLALYTKIFEKQNLELNHFVIQLYPNITVTKELFDLIDLGDLYTQLERHCAAIQSSYHHNVINHYSSYCKKAFEINNGEENLNYQFSRAYFPRELQELQSYIDRIQIYINMRCSFDIFDSTTSEIKEITEYENFKALLEKTIEIHNKIQQICIDELKIELKRNSSNV